MATVTPTTGPGLNGAVFDTAQILAYLVRNIGRSKFWKLTNQANLGYSPLILYMG